MFRSTASDASAFDTMRPYVHRALTDDEIRGNVLRAWNAARSVYTELGGSDGPVGAASKLSDKDKLRDELDTTVQSLSEAIVRMSGQRQRRSRGGWGLFLLIAGALVVLFNPATGPSTRTWLRDNLIGSEEEFDYPTPQY